MTIDTRDFGRLDVEDSSILEFRAPILGFEQLKRFVLLSDDEAGPDLMWLQSIDDPDVAFVLIDPASIVGLVYVPEVSREVSYLLELDEEPAVRVIAVVPDDFKKATVNLKSPVIINQNKKLAAQIILDADYPIRMRLFDEGEG